MSGHTLSPDHPHPSTQPGVLVPGTLPLSPTPSRIHLEPAFLNLDGREEVWKELPTWGQLKFF